MKKVLKIICLTYIFFFVVYQNYIINVDFLSDAGIAMEELKVKADHIIGVVKSHFKKHMKIEVRFHI